MKRPIRNNPSHLDPYEDPVRFEKLDAYESLIKLNLLHKKNNKSNK